MLHRSEIAQAANPFAEAIRGKARLAWRNRASRADLANGVAFFSSSELLFALAQKSDVAHKDGAFQASSPKNF